MAAKVSDETAVKIWEVWWKQERAAACKSLEERARLKHGTFTGFLCQLMSTPNYLASLTPDKLVDLAALDA